MSWVFVVDGLDNGAWIAQDGERAAGDVDLQGRISAK